MSVTTAAPPAAARSSALWQLTIVELKLFARQRTGPMWEVTIPVAC